MWTNARFPNKENSLIMHKAGVLKTKQKNVFLLESKTLITITAINIFKPILHNLFWLSTFLFHYQAFLIFIHFKNFSLFTMLIKIFESIQNTYE